MAADPLDTARPGEPEYDRRFSGALVSVMVPLWEELERVARHRDATPCGDELLVVRLELALLESTARRLQRVGVLAFADAQCVRGLVDELRRLLDPEPASASASERIEQAQDFLLEQILQHSTSMRGPTRTPAAHDRLEPSLDPTGDSGWT
jgi:hypothetical protein